MDANLTPPSSPSAALRHPVLAAVLSWLVPGLGQLSQGRVGKGLVFLLLVPGAFLYGDWLGEWKTVQWDWEKKRDHLPYLCQAPIGLLAAPALVDATARRKGVEVPLPLRWQRLESKDRMDSLHLRLSQRYDRGQLYTMVAGLLNVLVIFDALRGPAMGWPRRSVAAAPSPSLPDTP